MTGSALAQTHDAAPVLEEIVVTAEKREESLQKTPIAITALSSEQLAGVSQPENLNRLVPGLSIGQSGPSSQVYLRGVGNFGQNAFADPAVAFNMDGVYLSRFTGITGNFYDVARIEVLKGPQGTLYGRNATGGAINIVTNKPVHEFETGVGLDVGNYDLRKANGMINLPLSEEVAVRVAAQRSKRDGFQSDGYDDEDTRSARVGVLFEPSAGFELLVTGTYTDIGGKGAARVPVTSTGFVDDSDPWLGSSVAGPIALTGAAGPIPPPDFLTNGVNRANGYLDIQVRSITAQADAQLPMGALTIQANHMVTDNASRSYATGFLTWQDDTASQDSVEMRWAGDNGSLRWVGGLYYFAEEQKVKFWVDQGFLFSQTGYRLDKLDDRTLAAFGQLTYSVNDRVRLTGGARFTEEEKEVAGVIFNRQNNQALFPNTTCVQLYGTPPVFIGTVAAAIPQAALNGNGVAYPFPYCQDSITGDRSWNDFSWKGGIDYDLTDSSMMYLTVSRGFKAGGFFASGDHTDVGNTFEPEKLISYAFGSKSRFLGDRLQINAEAFYWDYDDHQENYLAPVFPSQNLASFNLITQTADARIYGLDVDLQALVTDNDDLSLKVQYLHAEYTQATFVVARPNGTPPSSACPAVQTNPTTFNLLCTGEQMPRSPTLSLSGDYHHSFDLGGAGTIVAGVNVQYSSSYWSAVDYNPLQKQDAFTIYGVDLSYVSPSEIFTITGYGDNLSDEAIYTSSFMYPNSNVAFNQLRAPRTYGVRLNVSFE